MRLSHRDLRVARELSRAAWGMAVLVGALVAAALVAPVPAVRFASLLGLGVAGAAFLGSSHRSVREYVLDLESTRPGGRASGRVRAEVASAVDLDPATERFGRPSPHTRTHSPLDRGDRDGPGDDG